MLDASVEMMIDSGSQTSVISTPMMKKLKLQKRLNTACQGVAAGVGNANILGRVEKCPVVIGAGVEFLLYFLVLDVPHDMMSKSCQTLLLDYFLSFEDLLSLLMLTFRPLHFSLFFEILFSLRHRPDETLQVYD